MSCSRITVANYMMKYAKDCNGDTIIDCADYAAIHKAGAGHCDDHWVPKSAFMQSFFALSGRDAEASESSLETDARIDPFNGDMGDFRRVVSRNSPTPRRPRRRQNDVPDLHDIATALGPWLVDAVAGSRRGNRRPGNEVQPPRRRRVRPHDRPIPTPGTTKPPVTTRTTFRTTRPPAVEIPTRRRFRPVVTAITTTVPPRPSRPDYPLPTSYATSSPIP